MTERILSISGKPGLFKLVSQGKNMLIVEDIATGKRRPAYMRDKVMSLADIAMYTTSEDVPLYTIYGNIYKLEDGKTVDIKSLEDDEALREYFAKVLPDFDRDRVYSSDIRKALTWYNQLVEAGITDFSTPDTKTEGEDKEETPEA
ncbi:MAG: DUF5606 domain-containing protein [Muribaculaceae bacterium]|nr:DUF5606 domain-containing protein [Muribaculaceae bacterium]MBP3638379.1 DUF5606 domain-containing protein [Muribaculaceae bacterium]